MAIPLSRYSSSLAVTAANLSNTIMHTIDKLVFDGHLTCAWHKFHLILHVLLKLANHLHIGSHLLLGIFLHRLAGHPQQFTASRVFIL